MLEKSLVNKIHSLITEKMTRKEQNGWVYIMSNVEYPELYKIGKTRANPAIRASALSRQTASIGKWEVEWEMEIPDITIAESILHYKFRKEHYEKEYFKINLSETKENAEKILEDFFGKVLKYLKLRKNMKGVLKIQKEILNKEKN
jgi:beta-galactosidase GanA